MLEVGFTSKEIMPTDPFYLMGYVGIEREKPALGVKDVPEINTTCFKLNGHSFVFSVIDVVTISRNKSDELKAAIIEEVEISPSDIHLIALHSHSCPNGTSDRGFNDKTQNVSYLNLIKKELVNSVKEGFASLEKATVEMEVAKIEGYYGNRNDINAPSDKDVITLKFLNKNNELIGSWLNIAVHSTVLGPNNRYCSYDLIGKLREYLVADSKKPVMAMMGAAGDISNRQYRQGDDFEELERTASGIYNQIKSVTKSKKINLSLDNLATLRYVIDYDNRPYFPDYHEKIKEVEAILNDLDTRTVQRKLSMTSKVQFERKLTVDHVHKVVVTTIYKFGDIQIILFGGELSSTLGRKIKEKNKDVTTIFINCSDDHQGYFIEEEKYGLYYETIATDVLKGVPEKIVENILALV